MAIFDFARRPRADKILEEYTAFREQFDAMVASGWTSPSQYDYDDPAERVRQVAMRASATRVDLTDPKGVATKSATNRFARAWQSAAWDYFDAIGELRYGFTVLANTAARATLQPGIEDKPTEPPLSLRTIRDQDPIGEKFGPVTLDALHRASEMMAEITPQVLSQIALNLCVAGECYLVNDEKVPSPGTGSEWVVLSTEELVPRASDGTIIDYANPVDRTKKIQRWSVRVDRSGTPIALSDDAYVARIWRPHPRWQNEPSSSMIGVLDSCEALLLIDQYVRTSTRSRLFAGAFFVPDGIGGTTEATDIEEALIDAALSPVSKEDAAYSLVPMMLTGPPEAGAAIKRIDLFRGVDAETIALHTDTLDRILTGIDLPKEFVKGLQDSKYANAVVVEESMYKTHIAPLLDLIAGALTAVYLRPRMLKEGFDARLVAKMHATFDPADIVTRPDKSQAANDGYDRKALSAAAWRAARGFSEHDAPSDNEMFHRLFREKIQVPQDVSAAVFEYLGGTELRDARDYVEKINADPNTPSSSPAADPYGHNPEAPVGAQPQESSAPAAPAAPAVAPQELLDLLGGSSEEEPTEPAPQGPPVKRDRSERTGGNPRPGELLPPTK